MILKYVDIIYTFSKTVNPLLFVKTSFNFH
jgi:hypothetical protein